MAKSHTGHLTGSDAVHEAFFKQYGMIRVDDLDELLETSALFTRLGTPRGDGVCIYAISGGNFSSAAFSSTAPVTAPVALPPTRVTAGAPAIRTGRRPQRKEKSGLLFLVMTIPLTRFVDWLVARDRRRQLAGLAR